MEGCLAAGERDILCVQMCIYMYIGRPKYASTSKTETCLDDLRKIDRHQEPPDEGPMTEMLWSDPVCCSVLQCVVVWCSVVQSGAVCCRAVQCVAVCCSVMARRVLNWPVCMHTYYEYRETYIDSYVYIHTCTLKIIYIRDDTEPKHEASVFDLTYMNIYMK